MSALLLNFLVGLIVSFLGTLPLGILNLTIVRISLRQGIRAAFMFALACALVELVYSYIAVLITGAISQFDAFKGITDVLSAVVLLGMGIYYIRKQTVAAASELKPHAFYLGTVLSLINLAAFPFWTIYTTLLSRQGWVSLMGQLPILVYVAGISLGTIAGLWLFVALSHRLHTFIGHRYHRFDQLTGLLFIGLAVFQSVYIFIF